MCLPHNCNDLAIPDKLFRLCAAAVICDGIIVHRPWQRQKRLSATNISWTAVLYTEHMLACIALYDDSS